MSGHRGSRRSRLVAGVASGALVVAAATAVAMLVRGGEQGRRVVAGPSDPVGTITKGMQPPFDPGTTPIMAGSETELFLYRIEEPRQAAIYSAERDEWRSLPVPPFLKGRAWVVTTGGPVGIGARCEPECEPVTDDGPGTAFSLRLDAGEDAWIETEIGKVESAEAFAESGVVGVLGAEAIFGWDGLLAVDEEGRTRQLDLPPGFVHKVCLTGSTFRAAVIPEPVTDENIEDVATPPLARVVFFERSATESGDPWKESTVRVTAATWAGRVMYGVGCGGNEIIMTTQDGYVTFDGQALHLVSTKLEDGLSNIDVALPGGGAVSFTRHAVVVVSGSGLSKLKDTPREGMPPLRQIAAVGDVVVYYERDSLTDHYSWVTIDTGGKP